MILQSPFYNFTRNSAVADKPRDAFTQDAMAWLTPKIRPYPVCLTTPNLVAVSRVRISRGGPHNWGAPGPGPFGTERVADLKARSSQYVLPRHIWSFYISKAVGINKEPQNPKRMNAGAPPPWDGVVADPQETRSTPPSPQVCYIAELYRSASKVCGYKQRKPKNWRTMGLCPL